MSHMAKTYDATPTAMTGWMTQPPRVLLAGERSDLDLKRRINDVPRMSSIFFLARTIFRNPLSLLGVCYIILAKSSKGFRFGLARRRNAYCAFA